MAPEIKFASISFNIPLLSGFANATFRRRKRNARRAQSAALYAMPQCNDSDWTFASLSSVDKHDKPAYAVVESVTSSLSSSETDSQYSQESAEDEETISEGLWIRFASQLETSTPYSYPLSEKRLARLRYRIAKAVVAAGMESSPELDVQPTDPFDKALQTRGALPPPVSSCYRGTYGQVMEALEAAGLVASQCEESGFEGGE